MRRSVRHLLLVFATLPALGCATTVGTVAGPVTTPISFFEHTKGTPQWAKVFAIPLLLPLGAALGFVTGAAADIGFVENGEYGQPPFDTVFDPADPRGYPPQPGWPTTIQANPGTSSSDTPTGR